jgi:hypothetical protein
MVLQLLNLPFRSVMAVALRLAVVLSIGAAAYEGWRHAIRASDTNAEFAATDAVVRCAAKLPEPLLARLSRESSHGNFDVAPFGCWHISPPFITNMREIEAVRLTGSYQMRHQQALFRFDVLFAVALSCFFGVLLAGLVAWSALRTLRWVLKG